MKTGFIICAVVLLFLAQQSAPPELDRVVEEARLAQQELAAARSGDFYYLLDVPNRKLFLKLRGVELKSYDVESVEAGYSLGVRYLGDALRALFAFEFDPPEKRPEIKPGSGNQDLPAEILKNAADPERPPFKVITLHCEPELILRFVAATGMTLTDAIRDRLALPGEDPATLRLRVTLPEEDFLAVRREVPERGRLLIVLPTPDPAMAPLAESSRGLRS